MKIVLLSAITCKDLKVWLPVSSHSANIVQRNAFRGQYTKYKCLENFVLYGSYTESVSNINWAEAKTNSRRGYGNKYRARLSRAH